MHARYAILFLWIFIDHLTPFGVATAAVIYDLFSGVDTLKSDCETVIQKVRIDISSHLGMANTTADELARRAASLALGPVPGERPGLGCR